MCVLRSPWSSASHGEDARPLNLEGDTTMMRHSKIVAALALALFLGAAVQVQAQDETKGTIKTVDTTRNEVVLKGTVKDTVYELNKDASVWLDGVRCKLGDLKADDKA